jgi:chromosome partitioning protein
VFDLVGREGRRALIVMNRGKAGSRLGAEVVAAAALVGEVAAARLGSRVAFARSLGEGMAVAEERGPGAAEVAALADEVLGMLE